MLPSLFYPRTLVEKIRLVRYILPVILVPIVVIYQLQVAFRLEQAYGHLVHYAAEIGFYSLVGPVVTWLTLIWVERKLAEKEALERQVRARTQQLASLTAVSPDAILSLDHKGRITSWNQGASRLFGYTAREIIGHEIDELLPDFANLEKKIRQGRTVQNLETSAMTSDGQLIRVDLTQTCLKDDPGEPPVSLLIIRDVTVRSERAAIVEEERSRIARDLHDSVAQTLYFLALKADMTRNLITSDPEQAVRNLKEIGNEARGAIRDVRRAIFGLKPLEWSEGGFVPALKQFVKDFAEQSGWRAVLDIPENGAKIPPRLEPTIFRLVQESLNNVAKHANARTVHVSLHHLDSPPGILLEVVDDGEGFEVESVRLGWGINQMKKRCMAAGGDLRIESSPTEGTRIRAEIPFKILDKRNG